MVLINSDDHQDLDLEWVALIMNARTLGYSKEDVQKALLILKESSNDEMQDAAV